MSIKYKISGIDFNSKNEIVELVREILYRNVERKIPESDKEFVIDLMKATPNYFEKKRGSDIVDIEVGVGDYNTKCFYLIYNDGSRDDFSVYKAIGAIKVPKGIS